MAAQTPSLETITEDWDPNDWLLDPIDPVEYDNNWGQKTNFLETGCTLKDIEGFSGQGNMFTKPPQDSELPMNKKSLLVEMNRMVARVLDDESPSTSRRLGEIETEIVFMRAKIIVLEATTSDLREENQGLKDEIQRLTSWSADFGQWGKITHESLKPLGEE